MALPDDLLHQAELLARIDRGKPRQVSLRRAESSAYYALFHLLVADAVRSMLPGATFELRSRMSRAFQHAEMKKVCRQLQQPMLAASLHELLPNGVSSELRIVVNVFVEAQEARHRADYDTAARFGRSTTSSLIDVVGIAFAAWKKIRTSDEARVFQAALAFASRWDR